MCINSVCPQKKTVPALYPESEDFLAMPDVFATGIMVGFIEWACIKAIKPHLDLPEEQSVGTHIEVNHIAATPPGMEVIAKVKLIEVNGKRLVFQVQVNDEVDLISSGRHERFIIDKQKFLERLKDKIKIKRS